MVEQKSLFSERARARRTDPETSHKAAARLPASDLEKAIMEAFGTVPLSHGLTIKEATVLLEYPEISVSPRFRPMERNGLIYDSEDRRVNHPTGRAAIVWKLTTVGERLLREQWNEK